MIENSNKDRKTNSHTKKTGCLTTYPSESPSVTDDSLMRKADCEKLWEKANRKISEHREDENKPEFKPVYRLKKNGKYCYNPELFKKKGWCLIVDSNVKNPNWGFCSTSCNIEFMKVTQCCIQDTKII